MRGDAGAGSEHHVLLAAEPSTAGGVVVVQHAAASVYPNGHAKRRESREGRIVVAGHAQGRTDHTKDAALRGLTLRVAHAKLALRRPRLEGALEATPKAMAVATGTAAAAPQVPDKSPATRAMTSTPITL